VDPEYNKQNHRSNKENNVFIVTDYGLDYQMIRVQFPVGAGNFSL